MLKDWKNVRKSKGISTWKNIKTESYQNIEYLWINNTGYGYTVNAGGEYKVFDTKLQALNYAYKYMRTH